MTNNNVLGNNECLKMTRCFLAILTMLRVVPLLGYSQESVKLKLGDPRWPLVEYQTKFIEDLASHLKESQNREKPSLNENRIRKMQDFLSRFDRNYYIEHYSKYSVHIDENWGVVYLIDENGRLESYPEVVRLEKEIWRYDADTMELLQVAFLEPTLFENKAWRDLVGNQNITEIDIKKIIRLFNWLKERFGGVPRIVKPR